jgi:hypothetical protein
MAGNNLKQIKDFILRSALEDDDQFVLQTSSGTTFKTTKSALLNDINTALVGLQTQIDSISGVGTLTDLRGQEDGVIGQQIYDIDFGVIVTDPTPIISLTVPNNTSTVFVQGIYDVTETGFKVLLSESPAEEGYVINWSVKAPLNLDDNARFLDLFDTPSTYSGVDGYIVTVSGSGLYFQDPNNLSFDTTSIDTSIATISGDVQTLQTQFNNLDLTYATDASVALVSSGLQTQIDNLDFTYATDVILQSISGAIQDQIDNLDQNYATDTSVGSISSNLQNQIDIINTSVDGITGGIAQVDEFIDQKLDDYILKALEKQIDDHSSDSTITYVGEADPGSATSSSVWRIKRIVETSSNISIEWADGNGNFDNVYDDRESLSYT